MVTTSIHARIANELGVRERQVTAAVELLDGGATVPFIARYRKEATGTLDDAQLRTLEERLGYVRELEDRRAAILEAVAAQSKLDDKLRDEIMAADSKAGLEDIYLPYKPKRRTKAQIAKEAGLEPLADRLLGDPTGNPQVAATAFINSGMGVADAAAAARAPALSWPSASPRTLISSESCARRCGRGAVWSHACAPANRRRAPSFPTTLISPKHLAGCPRTGSWRCFEARRKRSSTSPSHRRSRPRPSGGRSGRAGMSCASGGVLRSQTGPAG